MHTRKLIAGIQPHSLANCRCETYSRPGLLSTPPMVLAEDVPVISRLERQLYCVTCPSTNDDPKGSNGSAGVRHARQIRSQTSAEGASLIGIMQTLYHPHVIPMIANDYLSLWEVAHRWHGIDPDKTNPLDLPLTVQDALRYLCVMVLNGEVLLYMPDHIDVNDGAGNYFREIQYHSIDELPIALQSCAFARRYDKSVLDEHLISRHNLFERSLWGSGKFPDFWEDENLITDLGGVFEGPTAQEDPKPPSPNSSLFDQSLCQAIAKTLWDIDPNTTIEAMTKHPPILKYGNGGLSRGKNTLREWLSPVAPKHVKKPGRPKKVRTQ